VQTFFKPLLVNSNTEILHRYFESCLNMKIKVPFVKVFFAIIQSIRAVSCHWYKAGTCNLSFTYDIF